MSPSTRSAPTSLPGSPRRIFASEGIDFEFGGIGVPQDVGGIHISIWIVLVAAAITAAIAGVLIGLPTLRLRGDYLAIVTLGFGEIIHQAALNGDADARLQSDGWAARHQP